MADKKISELDLALQINNDAVFPMSQDNAGEPTTFKAGITQLGTEIAEDMTFSNLQTTSKKLVGAINELLSLGNPIILGTSAPTSSQGANGNLYIQYTAGTGGADDEVDAIYVKLDGAWCEISTGGGGGTTDYEDLSNKPQVNSVELVGNKSLDDLGIMPASLSKTVSGAIAHITDGADNIPVKSLVSQIVAVESGSGEKSPENPYSISGFDSGIITRCGKNMVDNSHFTFGLPSTTIGADINNITAATRYAYFGFVPPKATCIFSAKSLNGDKYASLLLFGYKDNKLTYYSSMNVYTERVVSNVLDLSEFDYFRICIGALSGEVTVENLIGNGYVQLELGSTATDFEAYNGNIYTFTFGQTVYGGHFDNKGNLVVTHGYIASYNGETINEPWISSIDEYVPNTSPSSGAEVVYPLTSPITLSITSQDIPTLSGENNIFSNCGDVEVTYYTDNADEIVEVAKSTASTPLHNYSTDEQIVGTWIDGSTVYEKTFTASFTNISSGTAQNVADISGLGINEVISSFGVCKYSTGSTQPDLYENLGLHFYCYIYPSGNLVFSQTMTQQTTDRTYDLKVTIQYTKSV